MSLYSNRPSRAQLTAFDSFHPVVVLVFFATMLIFSMAVMQPVYLVLSLLGSLSYSLFVRGWRATVHTVAWQLPLVVVLALANPLFSASGSTEVFRLGVRAFYLESFIYGACMGIMLAAVLLWFSNASRILSVDKVMALFGNVAPTVGLMISMVSRLIPKFLQRGTAIGDVQRACSAAQSTGLSEGMSARMRMTSTLMGWGMEDSLDTADAMRSRGWGAAERRTTYQRWRFRLRDSVALGVLGALVVPNVVLATVAASQFHFYPTLSPLVLWWGYGVFALLAFAPCFLEAKERVRWR